MPLNIDLQQICLHLFNFVILFAILYFLLYKPVKNFMAKREEYYKNIDKETNQKLEEASAAKAEYAKRLDGVEDEIAALKDTARKDIAESTDARIIEAQHEASEIIDNARKKAEVEKKKILASAQSEIAGIVEKATEKLVLNSNTEEAFDQFLSAVEESDEK